MYQTKMRVLHIVGVMEESQLVPNKLFVFIEHSFAVPADRIQDASFWMMQWW